MASKCEHVFKLLRFTSLTILLHFDLLSKMLLTGFRQLRFPTKNISLFPEISESLARGLFWLRSRTRVQSIKRF